VQADLERTGAHSSREQERCIADCREQVRGCRSRQLKRDISFRRRIIRDAVRRSRNSRVERRVTRREVDQIRATPFIESRNACISH